MCATPKFCSHFTDEIAADLIITGVAIAAVSGGSFLHVLVLFQQILTLTEKFGHPDCAARGAQYEADHAAHNARIKAELKEKLAA